MSFASDFESGNDPRDRSFSWESEKSDCGWGDFYYELVRTHFDGYNKTSSMHA